jgi:hypothetical protein
LYVMVECRFTTVLVTQWQRDLSKRAEVDSAQICVSKWELYKQSGTIVGHAVTLGDKAQSEKRQFNFDPKGKARKTHTNQTTLIYWVGYLAGREVCVLHTKRTKASPRIKPRTKPSK